MSDEVLSPDEEIIHEMGEELYQLRLSRGKEFLRIQKLRRLLREANKRIEVLEAELRFYADTEQYETKLVAVRHGDEDWEQVEYNAILEDRGERARKALEVLK